MKTLQSQRELHLKCVEAAGNAEVLEVVQHLEKELAALSSESCRTAWAQIYIRTGKFSPIPSNCMTSYRNNSKCNQTNHARVKEYFEQRNPNATVTCHIDDDIYSRANGAYCQARFREGSLFQ